MRVNAIQVLQENYFSSDDRDNMSFFEYARRESEDPTFWGWLFNQEDCDTFDHLSVEEKEEYHSFMEEVKLFSLKMDYIVVRHIYGDDDPMFSITRRNNFSVMPYHDTYDHNGGFNYSLDYTIENDYRCMAAFMGNVYKELHLLVGMEGSKLVYVDPETGREVVPGKKIALFVHQWREENESIPMVTAWNYHDGHNWRSIIIDYGGLNADLFYEEVVGEIADDILSQFNGGANDCINGMYETKDFVFKSSRSQSDPWIAHVDFA